MAKSASAPEKNESIQSIKAITSPTVDYSSPERVYDHLDE